MREKIYSIIKFIMTSYFCTCFLIIVQHVIIYCVSNRDIAIYSICEVIACDFKKYLILFWCVLICGAIVLLVTYFLRKDEIEKVIKRFICFVSGFYFVYEGFKSYLYEKHILLLTGVFCGILVLCVFNFVDKINHKNKIEKNKYIISGRDCSIDILKGLLIIVMIIGHSTEIVPIKNIIYSVHMPAFVIVSGYFHKKREFKIAIPHLMRVFLIPYAIFSIVDFVFKIIDGRIVDISSVFSKYILGVSFSNKIFVNAESVGPVYFVLVLFGVRVIYTIIDNCFSKESIKVIVSVMVSIVGIILGVNGYWLPWSIDCAMYAVVFYLAGYWLRKYDLLQKCIEKPYLTLLCIGIWSYMIYNSNFEIAFRLYYPYLLVIIGSTCGTVILCLVSRFLYRKMPICLVKCMSYVGSSTIYILIVHTIFRDYFAEYLEYTFDSKFVFNLIVSIVLQVLLGITIRYVFENNILLLRGEKECKEIL